jgi:mannitol-1-phosphate 5-dehydrogenase
VGKTFVGFGFGAIQGGLFLPEAFRSGNFSRLVVSEIDPLAVQHIRAAKGAYVCNVAESNHVRLDQVKGLEIFNPLVPKDRLKLIDAISSANELCTALPSYNLYDYGKESVASILAEGLKPKTENHHLPPAVVYAAENDARAAFRLEQACRNYLPEGFGERVVFSETVIAKMCSVVLDEKRIKSENLKEIVPGAKKSFLVESFDKVFIDEKVPADFERGITNFITKPDLDPFALTKFHGHNALHYCLGLKAKEKGYAFMHQAGEESSLLKWAKETFTEEAGPGLIAKFAYTQDELFTQAGFLIYAEDALTRMVNPYLRDPVDRVTRDPKRKLGWNDRLMGSIRLAMRTGLFPQRMIAVARIALQEIMEKESLTNPAEALDKVWSRQKDPEVIALKKVILVAPD